MHWKGLRILCPLPSVHPHASALDLLVSFQTYSFLALNKPSKTIHHCSRGQVHMDSEPLLSPYKGVTRKGAHCSAQWGVIPHRHLSGPLWVHLQRTSSLVSAATSPVGSSLNQATSTCRSMGHRCETRER